MWAVLRGHIELCQLLLDNGADLHARDSLGACALILAVQHAQYLTFLYLLDKGADPEAGDIRGASAVHWTGYKGARPFGLGWGEPVCSLLSALGARR